MEVDSPSSPEDYFSATISRLYPAVDRELTPLPRTWSNQDEVIPLLDLDRKLVVKGGGIRVEYRGSGKTFKDAASVRADFAIPPTCGLYYFEVTVVSKGRDGYIGVGLSAERVQLNRLPGWDMNSFGYHGDDGNVFTNSGQGDKYGPTFTTGDVIGCCLNMIDRKIFFTKNGSNLGTAFQPQTVPTRPLFPTVGLQTPGEVVEVNFGQRPFEFDFEGHVKALRYKTISQVSNFPVNDSNGHFQVQLHKIVSSYLEHQGFKETAKSFKEASKSQSESENKNDELYDDRRELQKLVLEGRITDCLERLEKKFPDLLESNHNIYFELRYRQLIEILAGTAGEIEKYGSAEIGQGDSNEICGGKKEAIQDFIEKGRHLYNFVKTLPTQEQQKKFDKINQASALLIDKDPLKGNQKELFLPIRREEVAAALSAALLSSRGIKPHSTLSLLINQTKNLHQLMVHKGVPQAAFTQPDLFLHS